MVNAIESDSKVTKFKSSKWKNRAQLCSFMDNQSSIPVTADILYTIFHFRYALIRVKLIEEEQVSVQLKAF